MDLLECPVCLQTYEDPVLLPSCGHTFCRRCVDRIAQTAPAISRAWVGGASHACPTCRSPFRQGEVRPNFALRQLLADRSQHVTGTSNTGPTPATTMANAATPSSPCIAHQGCNGLRRGLTRDLNGVASGPNIARIRALQDLGVPYGLAKLLDEEDRQIGMKIFLLDNSGSTSTYDGHYFEQRPNGTLFSHPCTRWEEIKRMAMEQAEWNVTIGTPCEFILLNPGPGALQEGRDFMRIGTCHPGERQEALGQLRRMLEATQPHGPTPLADRLDEIYQRVSGQFAELAGRGQRVVLVIATDGLPTAAGLSTVAYNGYNGQSQQAAKRQVVQGLVRLMSELSVFVVIRLTTDDDNVISYYNDLDEELEWPLEVLDDIESEAKEIRKSGNGWLTYSPLLHKIREGGTFVKLFDLLDERCLTPTEVSLFAQLLLRGPEEAPMPRSAEDFYNALVKAVDEAPAVYDPLRRCMAPPIQVSKAWWVVMPPRMQMSQMIRTLIGPLSLLAPCTSPEAHVARTDLVF